MQKIGDISALVNDLSNKSATSSTDPLSPPAKAEHLDLPDMTLGDTSELSYNQFNGDSLHRTESDRAIASTSSELPPQSPAKVSEMCPKHFFFFFLFN